MPTFSHDDVVQFMVTEAVVLRGQQDGKKARKQNEMKQMTKGHRQQMEHAGLIPSGGV
jgi:hypothetical protein